MQQSRIKLEKNRVSVANFIKEAEKLLFNSETNKIKGNKLFWKTMKSLFPLVKLLLLMEEW